MFSLSLHDQSTTTAYNRLCLAEAALRTARVAWSREGQSAVRITGHRAGKMGMGAFRLSGRNIDLHGISGGFGNNGAGLEGSVSGGLPYGSVQVFDSRIAGIGSADPDGENSVCQSHRWREVCT